VIFLCVLALIWIGFASVQDLRSREIANWINFSLIIFALGFRFFYCLFYSLNFNFFYQGLIGLGVFFIIGNLLYYGRMFAGGDAKLMISLGAVLPFSESLLVNVRIFLLFIIIFLFVGAFYGLVCAVYLSVKNFKDFKKEFVQRIKKNKNLVYGAMVFGLVFMFFGLTESLLLYFGILFFILPFFYFYAKAVDECCLVKIISSKKLTEGDWLYKDVKIGKRLIKANWEGLTKKDVELLKKKCKIVKIRQGIAFVPVFLISFLILIFVWFMGLINIF